MPHEEEEIDQSGKGGSDNEMIVEETNKKSGNAIRRHALERQEKFLQIILKLASISAYNDHGHLKRADGSFSSDFQLIPLLVYALQRDKEVKGVDHFVDLLIKAKVPPNLITNENLKQKMIQKSGWKSQTSLEMPGNNTSETLLANDDSVTGMDDSNEIIDNTITPRSIIPQPFTVHDFSRKRKRDDKTDNPRPLKHPRRGQYPSSWAERDSDDD